MSAKFADSKTQKVVVEIRSNKAAGKFTCRLGKAAKAPR